MEWLKQELASIQKQGIWRELAQPKGIDFSSNDYLGLADHPKIRARMVESLQNGLPLGSTGSRLLRGNTSAHENLENFLAEIFQSEAALFFNSGYSANVGFFSAISNADTEIFSDALNHASIVDGIRLSRATYKVFPHNDMRTLFELLASSSAKRKIIVTETVFSMDGDLAPLEEIFTLAREFSALLYIDEAHATGIFGQTGLGRSEEFRSYGVNAIALHTCGKALGAFGAFLTCSAEIKQICINRARSFIFSTAISPILTIQVRAALEVVREEFWRRDKLRKNFEFFSANSPILPIVFGSNDRVQKASHFLHTRGMDVRAIRYPTVALGQERLRITFHANHSELELVALRAALDEFYFLERSV